MLCRAAKPRMCLSHFLSRRVVKWSFTLLVAFSAASGSVPTIVQLTEPWSVAVPGGTVTLAPGRKLRVIELKAADGVITTPFGGTLVVVPLRVTDYSLRAAAAKLLDSLDAYGHRFSVRVIETRPAREVFDIPQM